jgi:hypothetical protein
MELNYVATGGTITICGDYKTHIFTSDATFCVSVLVILQVQIL